MKVFEMASEMQLLQELGHGEKDIKVRVTIIVGERNEEFVIGIAGSAIIEGSTGTILLHGEVEL